MGIDGVQPSEPQPEAIYWGQFLQASIRIFLVGNKKVRRLKFSYLLHDKISCYWSFKKISLLNLVIATPEKTKKEL